LENEFYKQLIEASPIGYALQKVSYDETGVPVDYIYIECNRAYEQISGFSSEDLVGKRATELLPTISDDDLEEIKQYCSIAQNGGRREFERFSEHTQQWYKMVIFSFEKDSFVTMICFSGEVLLDSVLENESTGIQSQLSKLQRQLEKLDNQKYVPLSLFVVDVNGLRLSIDAFGEETGKRIMDTVEKVLRKQCRADDFVARISLDEFVLLLTKTDVEFADKTAARISESFANEKINNLDISVSIGYAVKEKESDDLNDIFNLAEDEMYRHSIYESANMKRKSIDVILDTLFERSKREMLHSKRVSKYCADLASKMGFGEKEINQIRLTGLMHDIGKIGVDVNILNKEKVLASYEWEEIRKHPEIGRRILNSVNELTEISEIVFEHHEKWDGKGYPRGLKGEEISIQARIISVVDAFTSMTSDWPFKKTLTTEAALEEIERCSGTQFDPNISKVFVDMIRSEMSSNPGDEKKYKSFELKK